MPSSRIGVLIVGGGQAGARAAKTLRKVGYDGSIVLVGDEPCHPYERPALSKALLLNPAGSVPFVMSPLEYSELDVTLRLGVMVASIDRSERVALLEDGTPLAYDRMLIATGSRLRPLLIAGVAQQRVVGLRTLQHSSNLAARMAAVGHVTVIGGGFIGLEVAATALMRGCGVTVVEASDRLLPRLGCASASAEVLARHVAAGADIRLGVRVERGSTNGLHLTDGSIVPADLLVAGVGVSPDTDLAKRSGLEVNDGIVVNAACRTSDESIYAAGDVARQLQPSSGHHVRHESWQNANVQADIAARAIAGVEPGETLVPWVWSDQGSLNLQIAGDLATADEVVVRDFRKDGDGMTLLHFSRRSLVGAVSLDRGKDMLLIRRALAGSTPVRWNASLCDTSRPLRRLLDGIAA